MLKGLHAGDEFAVGEFLAGEDGSSSELKLSQGSTAGHSLWNMRFYSANEHLGHYHSSIVSHFIFT